MIDPLSILASLSLYFDTSPAYKIINEFQMKLLYTDPIERVLDDLQECESGGKIDAINFNDGAEGLHSYGLFQFQPPTFYEMNEKYKIVPDLEKNEVLNIIYDPIIQRKLAREMVRDKLYYHWKNCFIKLGFIE